MDPNELQRLEENEAAADRILTLYDTEFEPPAPVEHLHPTRREFVLPSVVEAKKAPVVSKAPEKPAATARREAEPDTLPAAEAELRTEVRLAQEGLRPRAQAYLQIAASVQAGRIGELTGGDQAKEKQVLAQLKTSWQALEAETQELAQMVSHLNQQDALRFAEREHRKLLTAIPDLDAAATERYLTKKMGFTAEQISTVTDYRLFELAEKARRYDQLKTQQETQAPLQTAPKVKQSAPQEKTGDRSLLTVEAARGILAKRGQRPDAGPRGSLAQRIVGLHEMYPSDQEPKASVPRRRKANDLAGVLYR